MGIINLKLMANPLNWITLIIWILTLGIAAHALGFNSKAALSSTPSTSE